MYTRRKFFLSALTAAGVAVGAAFLFSILFRGGERCEEPPLVYGREECPVCKMVVDYPPSAAVMRARVRGVERWYFFDDIGCLATWHREVETAGGEVLLACAVDRVEGRWIDVERASLLVTTEFTAMGTGLLAVAPENVERYKRGETSGSWRVKTLEGVTLYNPPKISGQLVRVVNYKCVRDKFHYGPAWSTPPNWYSDC